MKKKLIAIVLVLSLSMICLSLPIHADSTLLDTNNVISEELQAVMQTVNETEKIPVSVWTSPIDVDVVEELALQKTGLNREMICELSSNGKTESLTSEAIDSYIAAEREIYKRLQKQAHQLFLDKCNFLKVSTTGEMAYICSYAPMVIVELTASQIRSLATVEGIENVYYAPKVEDQAEMDNSTVLIRAKGNEEASSSDYNPKTGKGVKIGMVEYLRVPNTSNLPSEQVTIDPNWLGYEDDHATAVAEIMLSNGEYEGIAPDAQLYCTAYTSINVDFYSAVEWLLDNGVNVINMSAGNTTDLGMYTQSEMWVDHIAVNHSVHFVKSAGNRADRKVTHPGLAYNIITVGNLDDQNSEQYLSTQVLNTKSAYLEVVNASGVLPTNKPELVAPGTLIKTSSFPEAKIYGNVDATGTSLSAPHVVGVIAQMLEQYPVLKTKQDTVKAILTASVRHTYRQYDSDDNDFDKYGAGLIDSRSSYNTIKLGNFISDSFSAGAHDTYVSYEFDVTNSDEIMRVSLAWLKYNRFASGNSHEGTISGSSNNTLTDLVNLDLEIIAPDGTELFIDAFINYNDNNNLVIAQFDPEVYGYGTYKIQVWIRDASDSRTYYSVAWW